MDSIKKASSGHMGLPLGCAEIGAVLFGQEMCAAPLLARASLLCALHARLANLFQPAVNCLAARRLCLTGA